MLTGFNFVPSEYIRPRPLDGISIGVNDFYGINTGVPLTENISYQIDFSGLSREPNQQGGICGGYSKGLIKYKEDDLLRMSRWDSNPAIADFDPYGEISAYFPACAKIGSQKSPLPIFINGKPAHLLDGSLAAVSTSVSSNPLMIFTAYWYGNSVGFSVFNLRRFRIWDNGELIRDFRPAEKDGTGCLYDLVTETYTMPTAGVICDYYDGTNN